MIKINYCVEAIRVKKGISKSELSRRTGIEYTIVSGFLNSKRNLNPKLSTLAKYAEALDCSVKDLFIEKIEAND